MYFNPRTLQESATLCPMCAWRLSLKFQSTHPTRECDHSYAFDDTVRLQISIHAPYKRVRPRPFFCSGVDAVFQSTHPTRECDVLYK